MFAHQRHGRLAAEERPGQIDLQYPAPVLVGCLNSGGKTANPGFLHSAFDRPKRRSISVTALATAFASETSQCSPSVLPEAASASTLFHNNSPSMSSSATRQPSARNRFATASPMPRAAPVTSATFCEEGVIGSPFAIDRLASV